MGIKLFIQQNKEWKELFWPFISSVCLYFISLYIELSKIFTDNFYLSNYYTDSKELLLSLIENERSNDWLNFIYVPIYIILLAGIISILLYILLVVLNRPQKYLVCLKIGLLSQSVYAVNYFITVILKWLHLLSFDATNVNDVYTYQSLLALTGYRKIPEWAWYFIAKGNITELIFLIVLTLLIHNILNQTWIKSIFLSTLIQGIILLGGGLIYIYSLF